MEYKVILTDFKFFVKLSLIGMLGLIMSVNKLILFGRFRVLPDNEILLNVY